MPLRHKRHELVLEDLLQNKVRSMMEATRGNVWCNLVYGGRVSSVPQQQWVPRCCKALMRQVQTGRGTTIPADIL